MPSRREVIRMTSEDVRGYLAAHSRIILVTNGPDGLPHPMPMNYGLDDEARIVMTTFRKSQKVRNLERDPRAALLIESGRQYSELKSVLLYADAEIVVDPEAVARAMHSIRAEESLVNSLSGAMSEQVRASIAKRAVLRFTAFRIISWDHAKLGARY